MKLYSQKLIIIIIYLFSNLSKIIKKKLNNWNLLLHYLVSIYIYIDQSLTSLLPFSLFSFSSRHLSLSHCVFSYLRKLVNCRVEATTMMNDEWVRAAMTDNRVVVELLVRLKQAQAAKPRPQAVIPLRWGLRLPRSKPATAPAASVRCDIISRRKDGDSPARCSPTTPLSWSGGGGGGAASPSATADGFEETSRRVSRSPPGFRSKGTANTETSCTTTTTTKRSRRKKTFAELKEEEGLLLKERMCLKKELATLNATFKEQTARNDNLKRMKLDLNLQYAKLSNLASDELETICIQRNQRECSSPNHVSSTLPLQAKGDDDTQSGSCDTHEDVSNHDRSFLLPDLNIMLSEEDPTTETLSGMR